MGTLEAHGWLRTRPQAGARGIASLTSHRLGPYPTILLSLLGPNIFGFGIAFVSSFHQYLFFHFGVSQAVVGYIIISLSLGEVRPRGLGWAVSMPPGACRTGAVAQLGQLGKYLCPAWSADSLGLGSHAASLSILAPHTPLTLRTRMASPHQAPEKE